MNQCCDEHVAPDITATVDRGVANLKTRGGRDAMTASYHKSLAIVARERNLKFSLLITDDWKFDATLACDSLNNGFSYQACGKTTLHL